MARHIVWDWNGTLFHDIDAVVTATNASLRHLSLAPLTREEYRQRFCQPLPLFYQRLTGREMSAREWARLDTAFHDEYHRNLAGCGLADDATAVLADWHARGRTQSLLSMYHHDWLVPLVRRLGVAELFSRIDGFQGVRIGPKASHLVRHLAELVPGVSADGEVLLIGDSLDDAAAAAHVGARCVLYGGGVHHPERLRGAGVPVAHSLTEAVALGSERW